MSAWKHSHLDSDLANVLEAATVDPNSLVDDPLADAILELLVKQLAQDLSVIGEAVAKLGDGPLAELVGACFARGFVWAEGSLVESQCEVFADDLDDLFWVRGRRVLELGLADLLTQLVLSGAQLLDRLMGHSQGLDHRLFGDALRAGLDHE